jgi:histidine triad (HIT) family protein
MYFFWGILSSLQSNRKRNRQPPGESNKGENRSMEKDCLFCNIVNGHTDTPFLLETEEAVVFKDINPHAPVHLLIVPKRHIRSINDLTDEDRPIVAELLMLGKEMARRQKVADDGYKLLFNVEYGGGQRVFHLHLHLLAGKVW